MPAGAGDSMGASETDVRGVLGSDKDGESLEEGEGGMLRVCEDWSGSSHGAE